MEMSGGGSGGSQNENRGNMPKVCNICVCVKRQEYRKTGAQAHDYF